MTVAREIGGDDQGRNRKTMNENERNIETVLNTDRLTECPAVAQFVSYLPEASTSLDYDLSGVSLHYADEFAVVIVEHGVRRDTAFCGVITDAHEAVVRLARHTDPNVIRDDFDVLDEKNVYEAGDENE